MSTSPEEKETRPSAARFGRHVSTTKEALATFRELIVVVLVVVVSLRPEVVRSWMNRGDFKELDAGGIRVTAAETARKTDQKVGDAQQRIEDEQEGLRDAAQHLKEIQAQLETKLSPEDARKLREIGEELSASLQTSQSAQQDLTVARQAQEAVLQEVTPALPNMIGTWGIVVSGDKNTGRPDDLKPAAFEAGLAGQLAQKNGGTGAALYDRQGWFRTVIEFASNKEAQAALDDVRKWKDQTQHQRYAAAYVVNIDEWCPNRQPQQGAPVTLYKCSGS